jgi:hypothetical protein
VREIVIVIADVYLPRELHAAAPELAAKVPVVPGIQTVARLGERTPLVHGWRAWLAAWAGRADLAGVAPACVAAAAVPQAAWADADEATRWIATPVQLTAGLSRVHLDLPGILRLSGAELAALAADFAQTFGGSGLSIAPLSSGEFLLTTRGIAPVDTTEPARCAGADLGEALPRGAGAAPLRRLMAEIEMWLHGHRLNASRAQRGEPPVTALWPWGAAGRMVHPEPQVVHDAPQALGADAWLGGLWQLLGGSRRELPDGLHPLLAGRSAPRAVLVVEGRTEMQRTATATLAQGLARLDERWVSPALQALRRGELDAVTVILNDTRATLHRAGLLRLWRRRRPGLQGFA